MCRLISRDCVLQLKLKRHEESLFIDQFMAMNFCPSQCDQQDTVCVATEKKSQRRLQELSFPNNHCRCRHERQRVQTLIYLHGCHILSLPPNSSSGSRLVSIFSLGAMVLNPSLNFFMWETFPPPVNKACYGFVVQGLIY